MTLTMAGRRDCWRGDKGIYKGKTISSLTVIDGDRLLKTMVRRNPNKMHITPPHSGVTASC